jgi:hypothetical protein
MGVLTSLEGFSFIIAEKHGSGVAQIYNNQKFLYKNQTLTPVMGDTVLIQ